MTIAVVSPVKSEVIEGVCHTTYAPLDMSDRGAVTHFGATYNRALRLTAGTDNKATIHMGERTTDRTYTDADGTVHTHAGGWLEHIIVITRPDGSHYMTVGAIQRTPGADSEFHS